MNLDRRSFLKAAGIAAGIPAFGANDTARPNIVLIYLDDSGWSDFRPFGKPPYRTPNVERLAKQGTSFHNFYVPQAVCSASRAALLSGCFPGRTKVYGAHGPGARGLEPTYATLGEVLKGNGYRTAAFGKWHIGDQPETRPPARGFDESCGLMYSNDMWALNPNAAAEYRVPLKFWENGKVKIENMTPEDQAMLTTWYTEHATDFILRNKANPFLLYVPHTMPHVPLYCSGKFKGKSGAGLYGDVILEIDWSVGEISRALKTAGVENNTLIIFTSDNGPWTLYGNHAGKTPFRAAKLSGFDGGTRSACIMSFPGKIKGGKVSASTLSTVDLLPTIASLTGSKMPSNAVDGRNVWDLIAGKTGAKNPHECYPFSTGRVFEGVISGDGRWKLHLPHPYQEVVEPGKDGNRGKVERRQMELSLFDLRNDPAESVNVIDKFPEVAANLRRLAEEHQREFYAN